MSSKQERCGTDFRAAKNDEPEGGTKHGDGRTGSE